MLSIAIIIFLLLPSSSSSPSFSSSTRQEPKSHQGFRQLLQLQPLIASHLPPISHPCPLCRPLAGCLSLSLQLPPLLPLCFPDSHKFELQISLAYHAKLTCSFPAH